MYHDQAIAWASVALELMGEKTGAFTTTTSFDASVFTPEKLREFGAVVMNNTMLSAFGSTPSSCATSSLAFASMMW